VKASRVVVLVTRAAHHHTRADAIRTASNLHAARVTVITLSGIVARRVAIHAPRVPEDWNNSLERRRSGVTPVLRRSSRHLRVEGRYRR
jgi:hypothetical protein